MYFVFLFAEAGMSLRIFPMDDVTSRPYEVTGIQMGFRAAPRFMGISGPGHTRFLGKFWVWGWHLMISW